MNDLLCDSVFSKRVISLQTARNVDLTDFHQVDISKSMKPDGPEEDYQRKNNSPRFNRELANTEFFNLFSLIVLIQPFSLFRYVWCLKGKSITTNTWLIIIDRINALGAQAMLFLIQTLMNIVLHELVIENIWRTSLPKRLFWA